MIPVEVTPEFAGMCPDSGAFSVYLRFFYMFEKLLLFSA